MGKLTTHVLDTYHGKPAQGLTIELYKIDNDNKAHIKTIQTNEDGRNPAPLLEGQELEAGMYELVFHAGDYFEKLGVSLAEPRFLDRIPLRFGIAAPTENYHVPLLVTPWTYSTYRGS